MHDGPWILQQNRCNFFLLLDSLCVTIFILFYLARNDFDRFRVCCQIVVHGFNIKWTCVRVDDGRVICIGICTTRNKMSREYAHNVTHTQSTHTVTYNGHI